MSFSAASSRSSSVAMTRKTTDEFRDQVVFEQVLRFDLAKDLALDQVRRTVRPLRASNHGPRRTWHAQGGERGTLARPQVLVSHRRRCALS
jgi:hypothetical protein